MEALTSGAILVVDGVAPLAEVITIILERAGYEVQSATDGDAALEIAASHPHFDLLLSDLEIRGPRGDELAAQFRRLHPAAAVVFTTTFFYPEQVAESESILAKPFNPGELRAAVAGALKKRRALSCFDGVTTEVAAR